MFKCHLLIHPSAMAVSFFFVEYVARLLISPNKKKFVKDGMNLVKSADLFISYK